MRKLDMPKLAWVQDEISKELKDHPNYIGVEFRYNRSGKEIEIRGKHKKLKNYDFPEIVSFGADLNKSDIWSAIRRFVQLWKDFDNPDDIADIQAFIDAGEVYR